MNVDQQFVMKIKLLIHNHGLYKILEAIRYIILEDITHNEEGSDTAKTFFKINEHLIRASIEYDEWKKRGH